MKPALTLALVVCAVFLVLPVFAKDAPKYETGTLLDITHQDSSRVVGNGGSVISVDDREYQITVRVRDMAYVGSYWPRWRWSYEPTEFVVNADIKVRLTNKEMFILRDNGKELQTKIIKRIALPPK